MADHNIIIRNEASSKGYSKKLSAKATVEGQKFRKANPIKEKVKPNYFARNTNRVITSGVQFAEGSPNKLINLTSFKTMAYVGLLLQSANKLATFAVNIDESRNGNGMMAHNGKSAIQTVTSFGMNVLSGHISNELFNKHVIDRQNFSKDYHRELYNLNSNGQKYKTR